MKRNKLFPLALLSLALAGQESNLSVSSPDWNGLEVHFATKVEPGTGDAARLPGSVAPAQDRAHRLIVDKEHRRYFGYDLHLEPLPDGQTALLRIEPLKLAGEGKDFSIDAGWIMLGPSKFPVAAVVRAGDTVALLLLVNPATGKKVVDYLTVRRSGFDRATIPKTPRDFAVDDVELKLASPRVWVNGKLLPASAQLSGGITAHALWMHLGGSATFVVSLWPAPDLGLRKAGATSGNTFNFRDDRTSTAWNAQGRSLPDPASIMCMFFATMLGPQQRTGHSRSAARIARST